MFTVDGCEVIPPAHDAVAVTVAWVPAVSSMSNELVPGIGTVAGPVALL